MRNYIPSYISYEWIKDGLIAVFLEKKRVGKILKVTKGYQYYPKGGQPGEVFDTLDECKDSLEANE